MIRFGMLATTIAASAFCAGAVVAQTSPLPGPTAPTPSRPFPKAGNDGTIAPSTAECQRGWHPRGRWTKQQFDNVCAPVRLGDANR